MTTYARMFLTAALAACTLVGASTGWAGDRVVLVSWDGVHRDVLEELMHWQPVDAQPVACPNARHPAQMPVPCGDYLSCLPNLCEYQVIHSNCFEGKPLTRPQHAQMLSGYGPLETGEITNSNRRGLPLGLSIYERIDRYRPDVTTVHIAGQKFIGRGIITNARRSGALDLNTRRGGRDQYTGLNTTRRFGERMDRFIDGPYFVFIHYKGPDVLAHRTSHNSVQYREAIVQADLQLGALANLIRVHGTLDETEIFVTTDHGFDGVLHINPASRGVSQTWIASKSNSLVDIEGLVLDVTPTILDELEIPWLQIDPPFRGFSLLAGPRP